MQVANDLSDDIQKTKWGAVYIADADDLLCLGGGTVMSSSSSSSSCRHRFGVQTFDLVVGGILPQANTPGR